jgi:hypothetical protein
MKLKSCSNTAYKKKKIHIIQTENKLLEHTATTKPQLATGPQK